MERDENGKIVADKERFPRGIKFLSDYVHSKGLKFGTYLDYGTKTCAGYPGSIDHLETDANSLAEWGVDFIKMDGCNVETDKMIPGYIKFGELMNKTGRPIMYSCSWPAYFEYYRKPPQIVSLSLDVMPFTNTRFSCEDFKVQLRKLKDYDE